MEWSEARITEFLELYQKEELIWNPKHQNHKNRQKINDAWNRIASSMGLPVSTLKIKKNSLMACFRTHLRKKKSSITSGMGAEDVYEPIWFAYKIMEDFLAPVYDCGDTINTEDNASNEERDINEQETVSNQWDILDTSTGNTEMQNIDHHSRPGQTHTSEDVASDFPTHTSQRQKRRQLASEISDAQKKIKQTFETLNNVLCQKKRDAEDDDCDLYGKLLANKLRNYSKYERHLIMHEIDGLLLRKPPSSISNISCSSYSTSSPAHDSTDSLPQSPVHINIPNHPFSAASYVYLPSQSSIHRPSSAASSYTPMPPQSPVQISIPNIPSSATATYAPFQSQSPVQISIPNRPSSATTTYAPFQSQSPVQISIPNRLSSATATYAPFQSQSPVQISIPNRPSSATATYAPFQSQSPVQISIPNRPSSATTTYAPFQSQSPVQISIPNRTSSATATYAPFQSQSPVQITIPNRPSSATATYAPFQSQSPVQITIPNRPSSATTTYAPIQSQSPVQISIPNTLSSTCAHYQSHTPDQISISNYQPMPSSVSTTQSNQIHILSEEVISASGCSILQHALTNAEIDDSDLI